MSATEIIKPIETGLSALRVRADFIIVTNQEEYVAACQIALDGRSYIKDVEHKLGPGIESAKAHLDFLRNEKSKYVEPAKAIVETAARKAEVWKAEERRKAAAEEQRINNERQREANRIAAEERGVAWAKAEALRKQQQEEIERARAAGEIKKREADRLVKAAFLDEEYAKKQAAQAETVAAATVHKITVAPAVPKVAGIKARVNWKFRITDPSQVKRAYLKPDEVAIGAEVRAIKDKQEAERQIGGIEVYTEDGI